MPLYWCSTTSIRVSKCNLASSSNLKTTWLSPVTKYYDYFNPSHKIHLLHSEFWLFPFTTNISDQLKIYIHPVHEIIEQKSHKNDNKMQFKASQYKARKRTALDSPGIHNNKKKLRFSDVATVIITQSKSSLDPKSSWYIKQEISQFKRIIKMTSRCIWGTPPAQAMRYIGHCIQTGERQAFLYIENIEEIRGLEHLLSPEVYTVLLQSRRATIAKVLQEQEDQRKAGLHDITRIAIVSMTNSEFARAWRQRIMSL